MTGADYFMRYFCKFYIFDRRFFDKSLKSGCEELLALTNTYR